jgi:hypothetical protein
MAVWLSAPSQGERRRGCVVLNRNRRFRKGRSAALVYGATTRMRRSPMETT